LEKVVFIPAHVTPLKDRIISPVEHRVSMLKLALKGRQKLEISSVETERPGFSFTVDTLKTIQARLNPGDEIYFLMGADSYLELPDWKQPYDLIQLCKIVVFSRPAVPEPDLNRLNKLIKGLSKKTIFLTMKPVEISSTDIRDRVAKGLSITGLVPEEVERYIKEKGLYKK
jgi:nicotinate-nucleotide adenylyltransferase